MFEQEVVEFDEKGASNIGEAQGGYNKGYLVVAGIHAKLRAAYVNTYASAALVSFLAHTGVIKMKNRPDGGEYVAYSLDMHERPRSVYVSSSDIVAYLKARDFVVGNEENKKDKQKVWPRNQHWRTCPYHI